MAKFDSWATCDSWAWMRGVLEKFTTHFLDVVDLALSTPAAFGKPHHLQSWSSPLIFAWLPFLLCSFPHRLLNLALCHSKSYLFLAPLILLNNSSCYSLVLWSRIWVNCSLHFSLLSAQRSTLLFTVLIHFCINCLSAFCMMLVSF